MSSLTKNKKKLKLEKLLLGAFENIWITFQGVWLYFRPKTPSRPARTITFLKALAKNPKGTGAVLPSSKYLAQEMISHIKLSPNQFVVELGPGTGVITKAMLMSDINPKKIIAIEYESRLATQLTKRFPNIEVIEGDAVNLIDLLDKKEGHVDTIISGLPLRSLPAKTVQSILSNISSILQHGGKYIQFTYNIRNETSPHPKNFHLEKSKIIWLNIPPAKVQVFSIKPNLED